MKFFRRKNEKIQKPRCFQPGVEVLENRTLPRRSLPSIAIDDDLFQSASAVLREELAAFQALEREAKEQ